MHPVTQTDLTSQPDDLSPLVRKLALHADLNQEDQNALLALPHTIRQLEAGQYVAREGDKPTHCCLVISGFAIRHKLAGDGARQIINIHMSGDMCDLQNFLLQTADHNVQALNSVRAAFIPRDEILELAFNRPEVGKALWLETLVEGSIAREWILNVGRRNALTKLAHLLCEFAYRLDAVGMGPDCNYELPMTQEQLGDATGLTAVHVNRTLKQLDAAGLTQRTKRSVVITNLKKLSQVGDFRSMYLHMPQRAQPRYMQ